MIVLSTTEIYKILVEEQLKLQNFIDTTVKKIINESTFDFDNFEINTNHFQGRIEILEELYRKAEERELL